MASQRRFAGCPTLQCNEGFEQASYTLNEIDCVYVVVEEHGNFKLLPPSSSVANLQQTRVADLEISHRFEDEAVFSLTLHQTSNTCINVRHYIKPSIPCGQGHILGYDEAFDLLNHTKVVIELTAGSKLHSAHFTVDLSEICSLPEDQKQEMVVASSDCRTQETYHTPLLNSKATSVVKETPLKISQNHGVVIDSADGTPTNCRDIYSGPVDSNDSIENQLSFENPVENEPQRKVPQELKSSRKRKADATKDVNRSVKRTKTALKEVVHDHRSHTSSLSKEISAAGLSDSADSAEDNVCSTDDGLKHQDASRSRRVTDKSLREREAIATASQETTVSGASPRSAKSKLVIAISGSEFSANNKAATAFLKRHVRVLDTVSPQVDYLCIGEGTLKTTSKILKAVALGKPIISDQWIRQCLKRDTLLDPSKFIAQDEKTEKSMKALKTWSHGTSPPNSDVFRGRTIYMTPALKKSYGSGFNEIRGLVKLLGARDATSFPAKDNDDLKSKKYIALGQSADDSDGFDLLQSRVSVYHKDLISMAILRGKLDLGDEFRFASISPKQAKKGKK